MAASAPKGLIQLEARSSILHEVLAPRFLEGKREACEISFMDFDDVSFKLVCEAEAPNVLILNAKINGMDNLKNLGAQQVIDRLYPGCEIPPSEGYNFALRIDCDTITDPARFLTVVSEVKKNIVGGPLDNAFSSLMSKRSESLPVMVVEHHKNESMFMFPCDSKIIVIFNIDFADVTDKAIAKVFLQEFVEAQRIVRNAPPVSYSKDAPALLTSRLSSYTYPTDTAGYLSFSVEERHLAGNGKDKAITLFTGFRNYLHYHIKCSKTYLHMRMRKKVNNWMQVLNRAKPEVETEKKTSGGKTFVQKA